MKQKSVLDGQIDLFSEESSTKVSSPRLEVVKMHYCEATPMSWEELFSGFDTLKAITFSSGINFVYNLLELFSDAEIIFGCESVISSTIHEIMAFQTKLIEKIRKTQTTKKEKLIARIEEGTVKLFVARGQLSHEKIYLLSSADGRRRVIMGSANMSYNAFSGRQRENITYFDDVAGYDWYANVYEQLKRDSVDSITKKALELADDGENIDLLPLADTIRVEKVITFENVTKTDEDVEFILATKDLAKRYGDALPKIDKNGNGKTIIVPDTIIRLRRNLIDEAEKQKELRSEYPELIVNVDSNSVYLNGSEVDLKPQEVSIKNDIDLFLKYMDGYKKFHGDWQGMQYRYFEFANWFFCSPFMAKMRDVASRYNQNKLPYPVFGLVYGQSKAGKTSFLETLLKMMIGQKPKVSAPDFTRSTIEGLKQTVKGAPIIVDDLTQTRFSQHAIETIKNDDFGLSIHSVNYPAVVISANEDVKAVAPEVIRRTVICRVEAGLTNTEVMKSNVVRTVQQKIGTAFYSEYLRRMLERMPEMLDMLKSDDAEAVPPDILRVSSKVIVQIISEFTDNVPEYIKELSLENYFGETVIGKHAIDVITNAWRVARKNFKVSKKDNELRWNAGATYEADRIIKELPETLEARKSRDWIIMKLDESIEFFGINFRQRGLFG